MPRPGTTAGAWVPAAWTAGAAPAAGDWLHIDIDATLVIDLAQQKVPPGTNTVYLQTQTAGKYRNNPQAAKAAEDAAKEAEKMAADFTAAAKKAMASLDEATGGAGCSAAGGSA